MAEAKRLLALIPLVRAGARFVNGELVERSEEKVAA